jgi:regulator of protease activity HflC (stomatin/prohibitin superfamily)
MSRRSNHPPDGAEYWSKKAAQQQAERRVQMLRDHILRTQQRFWMFVAALIVVAGSSVALETMRAWAGGKSISPWRCVGGVLPGLLGLFAILGVSVAFVRDVYEMPDWRHAFRYTWLLLFGRAPLSLFDLKPSVAPFAPYPSITVQQGQIGEEHASSPLARFGGPGNVIIYGDSGAFLERCGRFTRVAGPGIIFLQRFEHIRETFDLRSQERTDAVSALTKDGIPVRSEVQVRLQIARPPASLAPPTPDIPHPIYKRALDLAGRCHLHAVNVDDGSESVARWSDRASGTGGTMRALIAGYRLDELLEPHAPEQDPHRQISQQLFDKVNDSARGFGAQVLEVRMGTPEPTLDEVKKERIVSWQAAWKSRVHTEEARGKAEAVREKGLARAHAQIEMIQTLTREFQELVEQDMALSAQFVALRFIEALRQAWARPGGMLMSSEAIRTLENLQRLARQDYALPRGDTGPYLALTEPFDRAPRVPIPILRVSDGPATATNGHSDAVIYIPTTGQFLIAGRPYRLHRLGTASERQVELHTVRFALAIPEDGWLDPTSMAGDYALVQPEPQVPQEGPGVQWTGEHWAVGQFRRDQATGSIDFVSPQPHIIGEKRGYVVALLKPAM